VDRLGTASTVLFLGACSVTLLLTLYKELELRRSEPGDRLAELTRIIRKTEPTVAEALMELYEKTVSSKRDGHRIVRVARSYLEALDG